TATSNWSIATQNNTPIARDRHAMAWEPVKNRLVMFGGLNLVGVFTFDVLGDLNVYDPVTATWSTPTITGTSPAKRCDSTLQWVPSLNKLVLFAGTGSATAATPRYSDIWALDLNTAANSATWTQLLPNNLAPPVRSATCTGIDTDRNRLVTYGGEIGANNQINGETWQFDFATNNWQKDVPTGTVPSGRAYCDTAYDPVAKRLALYGG